MSQQPRTDVDNRALLDEYRPKWEALREQKIRSASTLERLEKDLERELANAREAFGVDDLDQLRARIMENRKVNTQNTDVFVNAVRDVEAGTAKIKLESD